MRGSLVLPILIGLSAVSCTSGTVATAPVVSSFSPWHGMPGAFVKVTGSGFTGVTSVTFNGVRASFTVKSNTEINAKVPSHATNGPVAVTTSGGTGKSSAAFPVDNVVEAGHDVSSLKSDTYHLQADEWNSSAPLTIASDGNLDFWITNSGLSNSTSGGPGAYPSLYKGCHWGDCTANSGLPMAVSAVTNPGTVTTTYRTSTVAGGAWDASYDIWFNPNATTADNLGGLEMIIWLTSQGSVQPLGSEVASSVTIGGRNYNVWYGVNGNGATVSFVLGNPTTSVDNLDLGPLAAFAVDRGYMPSTWYLIDVEAGFEPWQGGEGLTVKSFVVCDAKGC